jgi:hypothetical protein
MSDDEYFDYSLCYPAPSDEDLSIGQFLEPSGFRLSFQPRSSTSAESQSVPSGSSSYYNLNPTHASGGLNVPEPERPECQPSSDSSLQSRDGSTVWVKDLIGSSASFFAPMDSGVGGQIPASVDSGDAIYTDVTGKRRSQRTSKKVPNGSNFALGDDDFEYVLLLFC